MSDCAIVTGATGLLGRQILKAFQSSGWKSVGTGFTRANPPEILKVDLSVEAEVTALLDDVKPNVVVHCKAPSMALGAANRFPDKVEADPDAARRMNVDASKLIAQATVRHNALLIYISTDYVFAGKPGEAPYEASAETGPTTLYGQTKLDGEKATLEVTQESGLGIALRVPVLYGKAQEPKESAVNVLMDAVWKAQDKNAGIKMDDWALRYPTNTEDVARVIVDVARKYLDSGEARRDLPKVLQFSSEDRMTKYQICEVFAEVMGLSLDGMIADKAGNPPGASVQRPYDSHLSTKELKDLGINVQTQDFAAWWRWQVKAFKK